MFIKAWCRLIVILNHKFKMMKARCFLFCLYSLSPTLLWAFDISNVVDPPRSSTVFVGDVVQNGMPLQMKQFYSDLRPVELLSYYRHSWSDNRRTQNNVPAVIEKKVGDWTVLSKQEGQYSVVVQVKNGENGGAEGLISVLKLMKTPIVNPISKKFPRLGGTKILSDTVSRDGDKQASTLILMNDYSVDSNHAFYRSKMELKGWTLVRGDVREGAVTLLFNKQGQQCEMAINSDGKGDSIIIVNIVMGVS